MEREKIVRELELIIWEVDHNSMWLPGDDAIRDAISLLKDQPEIVRCKDCKHGRICNNLILGKIVDCPKGTPHIHNLDWFCADGERR